MSPTRAAVPGNVHRNRGNLTAAQTAYEHALTLYQGLEGTTRDHADVHNNLGIVHADRGDLTAAQIAYEHALTLYQSLEGTTRQQAGTHNNLGNVHRNRGNLTAAQTAYEHALALYQALGSTVGVRRMSFNFALLRRAEAARADGAQESARLLGEALDYALDAALHADQRRFQFPTEHERTTWATQIAAPSLHLAFELAAQADDRAMIADLIAHTRSSGILTLAPNPNPLGTDVHPTPTPHSNTAPGPNPDIPLTAGTPATPGLGLDNIFRRIPPPALRMPNGRIALNNNATRTIAYQ